MLAPWWLRMAVTFAFVVVCMAAGVVVARLEDDGPAHLPVLGVVLMVLVSLMLAALIVALMARTGDQYREALGALTPGERNEAIRAAWRGPVPDDLRVREAAGRLARLQGSAYSKNRALTLVGYAVMALVFPLNIILAVGEHNSAKALLFSILGVIFVCGAARSWVSQRRLCARVDLLLGETHTAA
jgi:hypothetical protein